MKFIGTAGCIGYRVEDIEAYEDEVRSALDSPFPRPRLLVGLRHRLISSRGHVHDELGELVRIARSFGCLRLVTPAGDRH